MKKINCMIVDDEPIARDILQTYIQRVPELELVKSCRNATEAYEGLYGQQVDLIFLDIQMPVITGTEFMRSLRKPPLVVFTTAYSSYAVEGFELNSVDYLLKPITFERFYQAVQKVSERMAIKQIQVPETEHQPGYLFIRQDNRLVRVEHDQILYIQAERDFSSVYLKETRLLAGMHLKLFEDLLPLKQFLRVHRSYIVNLKAIRAIKGNVIELENAEVPIGASNREELFQRLQL
ncbi:LytTR family DNA-binding domain-containing protein [Mucilaginibacter sp. SG564]|uniref:LytR/AlgR family response regulator transcription factor n=1 Tax=unclassified Mucilaginibacter TaxID=2617802 RepID=UPI001555BC01|nr:response regulator transcription factor [Mucilaginibacter sp. SG564]NOW94317.1 DNA-binding LytR/AlgR family response regulator [Mucilaginibacter sp. SG564]